MKTREITGRGDLLARGLGWFSIGLGMAEILAPRQLSRWIGVEEHPTLMRMLGVRETLSGIGILAQERPEAALWSRVAGDGMDLALLGSALASGSADKAKVLAATAAVAGVTALDILCSLDYTRSAPVRFAESVITVNRPQEDVYAFWRDEGNLRRFLKIPVQLEIVAARPDEFIEWRSKDGMIVKSGSASFGSALGRDGTEVRVAVDGLIPRRLLHEELRRAKRLMETGEIPTTVGQSAGPSATAAVARVVHRLEGKEVA